MIFTLFVLTLLAAGCESPQATRPALVGWRVSEQPILAVTIPDTVALGDTLRFTALVFAPDPCWDFDHFEITATDGAQRVTAFARRGPEYCIQPISSFLAAGQFVPMSVRSLDFRFVGRDTCIVRTVEVRPH